MFRCWGFGLVLAWFTVELRITLLARVPNSSCNEVSLMVEYL